MIDSTRESLIALADVPPLLPNRRGGRRPHVSCVYRWAQRGCRGIVLETLQCGGTKVTSLEALQRFFEQLTATRNGEPTPVRTSNQRRRATEAAHNYLANAGW